MATLTFDDKGLIPAIVQDHLTGEVRMVAWMNAEAVRLTLATGRATFYSRSRQALWVKGETSGNTLAVQALYVDCDEDTLLVLVEPAGPSCHTGRPSCFFRRVGADGTVDEEARDVSAMLFELERDIAARGAASAEKSYTRSLLDGGADKIGGKIREEAGEVSEALENESEERVASEAADVIYHLLVGLRLRGIPLRRVIEVLASRRGQRARRKGESYPVTARPVRLGIDRVDIANTPTILGV